MVPDGLLVGADVLVPQPLPDERHGAEADQLRDHPPRLEFRTSIDLNPNYATARQWYAQTLASVGRLDEAKAEIERALEADPTSLIINAIAGHIHRVARDDNGALERYHKTLEMDPAFEGARVGLVLVYASKAMYAEAAAEADKIHGSMEFETHAWLAAKAGRRPDALRFLREMEEHSRLEYLPPTAYAFTWLALGEKERAFALFEKACAEHDVGLRAILVAGEFPDRGPPGAVRDGPLHVEPLDLELLAAGDHVHVVPAPQAVIGHR